MRALDDIGALQNIFFWGKKSHASFERARFINSSFVFYEYAFTSGRLVAATTSTELDRTLLFTSPPLAAPLPLLPLLPLLIWWSVEPSVNELPSATNPSAEPSANPSISVKIWFSVCSRSSLLWKPPLAFPNESIYSERKRVKLNLKKVNKTNEKRSVEPYDV